MSTAIKNIDIDKAWEIDQLWCHIDSQAKYNKQLEYIEALGIPTLPEIKNSKITVKEGLVYGNLAEIYFKQNNPSEMNAILSAISASYIASVDLIILKAYDFHRNHNLDAWIESFANLNSLSFEEDKNEDEFETFYKLLAFSPYRQLSIIDGLCYKALLHAKHSNQLTESFETYQQLWALLENLGQIGFQESRFYKEGYQYDLVVSELIKYFYGSFIERSKEVEEFVPTVNRIKDHVFRKDMLYSPELRHYLLDIIANHEIYYFNRYSKSSEKQWDKLVSNIKKYMKNFTKQLSDFPDAQNVLKEFSTLIKNVENSNESDEIMQNYQILIINLISKSTFYRLVNSGVKSYKVNTFTDGELNDYKFFSDDNKDIIPEYLKQKESYYTLDNKVIHNYFLNWLDSDPANGEYLYNVIRTYYKIQDWKSSILLIEKYLLLNDSGRMYNKIKVLIIAIKILANVKHKFDDALTYSGDLLSIIDTDFAKPVNGRGYGTFYEDSQNRIKVNIYLTAGSLYASYALHSEFDKNYLSRLKKAMVLLEKVIVIDEKNYIALTNLGRVYLHLNRASKAEMYLSKSLLIKPNQPVAIASLSVMHCMNGDMKTGYKIINKAIEDNLSTSADISGVLLHTVRAWISYYHAKERYAFNSHYNKHKLIVGIGNGVTLDDIDNELSSDEEVYDSDEEADEGEIQIGINKIMTKRLTPKFSIKKDNDAVSQSDISIGFSESGAIQKWLDQIDAVINGIKDGKFINPQFRKG